jgi:hypothetical protein
MRLLVKYLSLLIFSGLIIPVCTSTALYIKALPLHHVDSPTHSHKLINPFFYNDIVRNMFPVLKK